MILIVLGLGLGLSQSISTCAFTNRLCIEETTLAKTTILYYPTGIIPQDLSFLDLKVYLNPGNLPLGDPCVVTGKGYELTTPTNEGGGVNSTRITFDYQEGNSFHLVLKDDGNRQCIQGPSIEGRFAESVEPSEDLSNPDNIAQDPGTMPGADPIIPDENQSQDSSPTLILTILFVSITLLLIILILLYYCCKRRRTSKPLRKEAIVEGRTEVVGRWDEGIEDVEPSDSISNVDLESQEVGGKKSLE
jgi:hypothetical protein